MTTSPPGTPAAGSAPIPLPPLRRNLAYVSIIVVVAMLNVAISIANVALPQLSRSLDASPQATVWVTTSYLLATGCAVPAMAALGDQFGQRPLYLAGLPLYSLASLGCALSPNLGVLVAARALMGLAAAMVFAGLIPIMRLIFPAARLGTVLGINATANALGTSAGPTLGGLILAHASWPWLFLINVPLGLIAFGLGLYGVPRHPGRRGDYDGPGALLVALAIAAFFLGTHDLANRSTLGPAAIWLAVCAVGLVAFLHQERRAARPVLPLSLWRSGVFTLSVTTAFCSFFGQGVAFVALPLLFQSGHGASPLTSALLFTPWPAVIVFVAPVAGRLADRVRPSVLTTLGLGVYLIGLIGLALLGPNPATWRILVGTGLAGLGFGFFQSPNNREMQLAVPLAQAAPGAAVLNLNRSVAQSAGSGAVSIALALSGAVTGSAVLEARAATNVLWVAVGGALFALVLSATKLRTVAARERTDG